MFLLWAIIQNPTPQLNVFNISSSEIFLLFNHLKILFTLIFDKSKFKVRFLGMDLNRFSTKPPPVIWAEEFINPSSDNLIISLE